MIQVRKEQPDIAQAQGFPVLFFVIEQVLHSSGVLLILISSKPAAQAPYRSVFLLAVPVH